MSVLRNLMLPLRRIRKLSADQAEEAARRQLDLQGIFGSPSSARLSRFLSDVL